MKYYIYRTLLYLLRVLVYIKRGLFVIGGFFQKIAQTVNDFYLSTLCFQLYKACYRINKRLDKYKIPLDGRLIEFLGKRGTLQVLFFVIVLFVVYPESRLHTQDTTKLPGRDTIIYKIIGSGEQDFAEVPEILEEFGTDSYAQSAFTFDWREGAVAVDSFAIGDQRQMALEGISGVVVGGSAMAKPSIFPGAVLPTDEGAIQAKRTESLVYEVQSGDVIGNIAENFGLNVATILWANGLTERSYIRPGDKLVILPVDGVVHKVVRGDTVSKIARLYNAESGDIVEFNRLQKEGADIVIGEELVVPGGEKQVVRAIAAAPDRRFTPLSSVAAPPPSVEAPAGTSFLWPTSVRRITQYFGNRGHTGVDIAGPVGTPLYASKAGTVVKAGWNAGGYGNYVVIDHGGGVQTLYGHASKLYVSAGDAVEQGQTIALMGSTGRSTGPHIHFEVRVNGSFANPLKYVR